MVLAGAARADSRVDIIPSVSLFSPAANAVDEQGAVAKFASVAGFGGRLTIWFNENVGIEGTGHYFGSSLDGELFGQPVGSIDTKLFYGSAQVVVGLGQAKRFLLHGGIGFQGSNYDTLIEGGNIMTGVVGFSGWAPLGETVALRADIDSHIHTQFYEVGSDRTRELTQFDMIFSIGLQFRPGGR
jgi:opacity protein-like surface antigen